MLCFNSFKCIFVNIILRLFCTPDTSMKLNEKKEDENTKTFLFRSLTKIPLTLNILDWKSALRAIIPDGHKSD